MEGAQSKVRMVGFRRLAGEDKPLVQFKRFGLEEALINVVLVELGSTETESQKLSQIEQWIKTEPKICLWKVIKKQAFYQSYLEMMKQSLPILFVSLLSLEQLSEEPLLNTYKITLQDSSASVSEVLNLAKDNIERVKFIILKDNIDKLDKQNYFHAGVALITSEAGLVIEEIRKILRVDAGLRQMISSSSINTEDLEQFNKKMETRYGEGVKIASPEKKDQKDPESAAWKAKNDTPGVGTYDLTAFSMASP